MKTIMIVLAIIAYMAFVIVIGIRCSKANKNTDDFYLGGRKLGPLVTAMSAEASDMSSWLLMGLPGVVLLTGLAGNTTGFAEAFWTAAGLAAGTYFNWLVVSKRIRIYSEKIGASTIPDFFSNRFGDKKGILALISALVIIVFFVPYTASGFSAIGKLFNSLFGLEYHTAMIIGGFIVVFYTILGGFLAASTTDLAQSVVMTVALVVIVVFGVSNAGGVGGVKDAMLSLGSVESTKHYFSLTGLDGAYGILPIASTMAWGLGYFGMPHILLRFMAIEDKKKLKMSRRIASIWVVISMGIAILIGAIGLSFCMNSGRIADGVAAEGFDAERIIIYMADAIADKGWLAAIVAGVILAGILAATMSTADSQLLAAASSVSENIIGRFIKKDMTEKGKMLTARLSVAIISVISMILAWNPNSSVFRIVSFAWAGFGAAFGANVLLALFWRRSNKWGALAGMISGGATVFIWKFGVAKLGGLWSIYELLPAFIISAIFIVVVSLATGKPEKSVTDDFDAVAEQIKK